MTFAMDSQDNKTSSADEEALRAEVQQMGERLAARGSVALLFRAFALFCVSIMAIGVSSRLMAESIRLPKFFWPIAAIGIGSIVWSLLSLRAGRRLQLQEHEEFVRYRELRARAGLDP